MHGVCGSFIDGQMSKQKSKTEKKNMRKKICRVQRGCAADSQPALFPLRCTTSSSSDISSTPPSPSRALHLLDSPDTRMPLHNI